MDKSNINVWQFLIYLAILLLGLGASYGTANNRLNTLEDQAKVSQKDHETVISLTTKIDRMIDDIREIKIDVKEIKSKIK